MGVEAEPIDWAPEFATKVALREDVFVYGFQEMKRGFRQESLDIELVV